MSRGNVAWVSTLALLFFSASDAFVPGARLGMGLVSSSRAQQSSSRSRRTVVRMAEAVEVSMPALSSTMTEGKIVEWTAKVGDKIKAGDTIMVVESDKADMDVESFEEGFLAKIIFPDGASAPVGATVALLSKTKDDIPAVQAMSPGGSGSSATPVAADPAPAPAAGSGGPQLDVKTSEVSMPALSSTMTEGKIVEWTVKVGDKIKAGDTIMVVESDKADMDVESFESGYVAALLAKAGESTPVGAPCALLVDNEADIEKVKTGLASGASVGGGSAAPTAPAAASNAPSKPDFEFSASAPAGGSAPYSPPTTSTSSSTPSGSRVVASGYAKKIAGDAGVDLKAVSGTGPGGRITGANVLAAAGGAAPPKPTGYRLPPGSATPQAKKLAAEAGLDLKTLKGTGSFGRITADDILIATGKKSPITPKKKAAGAPAKPAKPAPGPMPTGTKPMDGMMKAVAKNMEKTLDVPIFRVSRAITTDNFDNLYKEVKGQGVTVSALLAKAVAMTLERYPILNAAYDPAGAIKYNPDINIAMAVALDGGLITPTLKQANKMNILALGAKWKELVKKAQEKRLSPDEYTTGTFTISNLGMYGVSAFDAILPPGQGSILAIGGSIPTVVVRKDGSFAVQKQMTVTITCDHRHIYGADAAEFLRDLAELMEDDVESLLL